MEAGDSLEAEARVAQATHAVALQTAREVTHAVEYVAAMVLPPVGYAWVSATRRLVVLVEYVVLARDQTVVVVSAAAVLQHAEA